MLPKDCTKRPFYKFNLFPSLPFTVLHKIIINKWILLFCDIIFYLCISLMRTVPCNLGIRDADPGWIRICLFFSMIGSGFGFSRRSRTGYVGQPRSETLQFKLGISTSLLKSRSCLGKPQKIYLYMYHMTDPNFIREESRKKSIFISGH